MVVCITIIIKCIVNCNSAATDRFKAYFNSWLRYLVNHKKELRWMPIDSLCSATCLKKIVVNSCISVTSGSILQIKKSMMTDDNPQFLCKLLVLLHFWNCSWQGSSFFRLVFSVECTGASSSLGRKRNVCIVFFV